MSDFSPTTDRDTDTTAEHIETVRNETIAILACVAEKAQACSLPEPPPVLEDYRRKLVENTYQVLVVGEAKRGKSTFVNALIGRDLLPTDVDVATCQVFRIRQSEQEAFCLRFEDGSKQEIATQELGRYGSQTVTDVQGTPRLDQLVRWIEVDLPTRFLPRGVSLLDTPGVGSLYAAHAQITQRFVPLADAVIFVLDSGQPIIQAELEFIETLLGVTSNIFFIQTKVDQYHRDQWQAIQQRNQAILRERFGTRLPDVRIWPISSRNLLKATQTGDEEYLLVSHYQQLATTLRLFLFRVAGWNRAATAIQAAERYYDTAAKTLAGRVKSLTEESEQKRNDQQQEIIQRKGHFDTEWGLHGQKRQALQQQLNQTIQEGRQTFLQVLQLNSPIEVIVRRKIEQLKSLEEAKLYSQVIDAEVMSWFFDQWRENVQSMQQQCLALLTPFLTAANEISFPTERESISRRPMLVSQELQIKVNWFDTFKKADMTATSSFGLLGLFFEQGPAALFALCWSAISGWRHHKRAQVMEAKKQLNERLEKLLQTVQHYFLEPDSSSGYQSRVEGYFSTLHNVLVEQVQQIAMQKSMEAQAEINRLSEQAQLDEQQRRARAQQGQDQMAQWEDLHQAIKEVVLQLKVLDQSLGGSSLQ